VLTRTPHRLGRCWVMMPDGPKTIEIALKKLKKANPMLNLVHISPWDATLGLMQGAGRVLLPGGPLYLYGPYMRDDVETAPSNLAFDASLKARDQRWGLRRVEDVVTAAEAQGLRLDRMVDMPANNLSLIFRRAAF